MTLVRGRVWAIRVQAIAAFSESDPGFFGCLPECEKEEMWQ